MTATPLFSPMDLTGTSRTGPGRLDPLHRRRLTRAVERALRGTGRARLSVSACDLTTGAGYSYGTARRFVTASIVKVDILAALLLRLGRQGRSLDGPQREQAARMIIDSDNDAASALWAQIGGAAGLSEANEALGLRETTATGAGWGLTGTSARDQIRLLRALAGPGGPLAASDRELIWEFMGAVNAGQRWGVGAAAGSAGRVALKNGWLPRSADGGLWVINSIGRIRDGHDYLIAVLSDRNATKEAGIALVERVAVTVMDALRQTASR